MIKIDGDYCEFREDNDPNYPGGKAIDAPTGDSIEGTQIKADLVNTTVGFFQAAIVDAHNGHFEISGVPDHAHASDVLDALKIISARVTDDLRQRIENNVTNIALNFEEHNELRTLIAQLDIRITILENSIYLDVADNPFIVEFMDLYGIYLFKGNWNVPNNCLECTRYDPDLSVTFENLSHIELISGIWNAPYSQLEC